MRHPALAALFLGGIFVLAYHLSPAQSGWVWQNPSPQGNDLGGIHTFSKDTVLVVGDVQTFLLSTDRGTSWQSLAITGPGFTHLNSLRFVDSSTAFLSADSLVLKSTNAGRNWSARFSGPILDSYFLDRRNCYLLSGADGFTATTILSTHDGGNNWYSESLSPPVQNAHIAFADSLHGWILGYQGELYSTSNGGASWTSSTFTYWGNLAIYFYDIRTGWIVGEGANICKSTDGGISWSRKYSGDYEQSLRGIYFKNLLTGWAWGPGLILKTTNGGASWSNQSLPLSENVNAMQFADANVGWAVGNGGTILQSADGGTTWNTQTQSLNASRLGAVQFVSPTEGWATGLNAQAPAGIVFHTTDGGNHWASQINNLPAEGTSLCFMGPATGWVSTGKAEAGGAVYATTDNGTTWFQTAPVSVPLKAIKFTTPTTGWAVGGGKILKTTDGGGIWVQQRRGLENLLLQSFDFVDSLHGWVCGRDTISGTVNIARSTDASLSWIRSVVSPSVNLLSLKFINARLGWAAGDSESIFGTADGGVSWTLQHMNATAQGATLHTILFTDSLHGWAAGGAGPAAGIILQTTNGGHNWYRQQISNQPILGISFFGRNNGWVVGEGGMILGTNGMEPVTSVGPVKTGVPERYFLFQNYPNPFNPKTGVRFEVPALSGVEGPGVSNVKITVYDLLGREVAVLVNERKAPGNYEVSFDGSRLASGVFICRMAIGTSVHSIKMLLLR